MQNDQTLAPDRRQEIADGLSRVLADSYTLYLKTHNFHWNVEGPLFFHLHTIFEQQYTALALAVDMIAERIRALDYYAPGSYAQFSRLSVIEEEEEVPSAEHMVHRLAHDNEAVARTIRSVMPLAQEAKDEATVTLLGERLVEHEKNAWMLRSHLK